MTAAPAKEDKRDWRKFWTLAENIVEQFGITPADKDAFVHDFFGVVSMKDRPEKCSELLDALEDRGADVANTWLSAQRKKITAETPPAAPPVNGNGQAAVTTPEQPPAPNGKYNFTPHPILSQTTTLMGIPLNRISEVLNLPHADKFYKSRKDFGTDITVLSPTAVRTRFNKVFGPMGFGWRIVPIAHVSHVDLMPVEKEGKTKFAAAGSAFVMEYAVVFDNQMSYVQTSAFSDSHMDNSGDVGYSLRGMYTSLMKQALREFGGYQHFIDVED